MNEVVPRAKLIERGCEIADHIMKQHRVTRRVTSQIVRRPWKKRWSMTSMAASACR